MVKRVIERMSGGVLRFVMTGGMGGLGLDPGCERALVGGIAKEVGLRR